MQNFLLIPLLDIILNNLKFPEIFLELPEKTKLKTSYKYGSVGQSSNSLLQPFLLYLVGVRVVKGVADFWMVWHISNHDSTITLPPHSVNVLNG